MALYVLPGLATITTSYKTAAVAYATSAVQLRRGKVMELILGATGVPNATDCPIQWDLSRQTAVGTAMAFTPNPMHSTDAPACATAGVNATVEGTITASSSLFNVGANQRQSINWKAFDENSAPTWPATANNGLALRALSPNYASTVSGQMNFVE